MTGQWAKVQSGGALWISWDQPRDLTGVYAGHRGATGQSGKVFTIHQLKVGDTLLEFSGTVMLDERLEGVGVGERVRVVFGGQTRRTKSGGSVKVFEVHKPLPGGVGAGEQTERVPF